MQLMVSAASREDCDKAQSFLQSGFWGEFKSEFGWKPRHFTLEAEGLGHSPLLVLERGLVAGFRFAYVPHGPDLDLPEADRSFFLADLARAIEPSLSRNSLFIRFDPPWHESEEAGAEGGGPSAAVERPAIGSPLRRAAADVQPPDTVLLGLGRSEDELLAAMKPKWRYNVRLAEKKGVAVAEEGASALGDFYSLYEATSARDRIALHPRRYYERQFELASAYAPAPGGLRPDLRLWVARYEGEALAAIITIFRGSKAVYLYGASSDSHRNLMPAYALQWAAIRAAKAAGCSECDFYGIPPTEDPGHPMAGLYRFKTGFGGVVAHRAGSWDYPLRPAAYAAFRAAEAARTWYFKDFRKRLSREKVSGHGE